MIFSLLGQLGQLNPPGLDQEHLADLFCLREDYFSLAVNCASWHRRQELAILAKTEPIPLKPKM